jgi:hypothetical protein
MYHIRERSAHKFCYKNMKEIDHMESLGIGGNIILKWILNK